MENNVNIFLDCDEETYEKILAEAMVVGAEISSSPGTEEHPCMCIKNVRLFLTNRRQDTTARVWIHDRFFNRTLIRLETENSAIFR